MTRIINKNNKLVSALIRVLAWVLFIGPALWDKCKNKPSSTIKKILVFEFWGIGDVVLMSSVLKPLKRAYPQAQIYVLAKSYARGLLEGCGLVDHFIVFDFPWTRFKGKYDFKAWPWAGLSALINALKAENFDLILDARDDIRNNILSFLIKGKKRVGYAKTGGGVLLTDWLTIRPNAHRVEAWHHILSHLKIDGPFEGPFLSVKDKVDSLKEKGQLLIGIHPGAGQAVRRWPKEKFEALGNLISEKYNVKIIQFVDPDGFGNDIKYKVQSLRFAGTIDELTATISNLDLLICNDTGVMHIAAALNVPVVAIFGPGDVSLIGPYGKDHAVVMKPDVPCRPCFDYCKFDRPFCVLDIPIDWVIKAADGILKSLITRN